MATTRPEPTPVEPTSGESNTEPEARPVRPGAAKGERMALVDETIPNDEATDYLVVNNDLGIRQAVQSFPVEGISQPGMQRFKIRKLLLHPGLNRVPAQLWDGMIKSGAIRERTASSAFQLVGRLADGLRDVRETRAIELIRGTGSLDCLKALAKHVKSDKLVEAVERQIDEVTRDRGAAERTRRAQRAHVPTGR